MRTIRDHTMYKGGGNSQQLKKQKTLRDYKLTDFTRDNLIHNLWLLKIKVMMLFDRFWFFILTFSQNRKIDKLKLLCLTL